MSDLWHIGFACCGEVFPRQSIAGTSWFSLAHLVDASDLFALTWFWVLWSLVVWTVIYHFLVFIDKFFKRMEMFSTSPYRFGMPELALPFWDWLTGPCHSGGRAFSMDSIRVSQFLGSSDVQFLHCRSWWFEESFLVQRLVTALSRLWGALPSP